MLIFGKENLATKALSKTPSKDCICVRKYDLSYAASFDYTQYKLALLINTVDEGVFANAAGVNYLLIKDIQVCKQLSCMAEFYLFDAKLILIVDEICNLYEIYESSHADGVMHKDLLKKCLNY